MDLCWTCSEICLELPKSRYLVSLYNDLMDQFEGSMITSENSSVACESSRVIILKSRLNTTGHSTRTSEVRDIFDRQTHVPNGWWQLMCSHVLQLWDRRNSMTAPIRNITPRQNSPRLLNDPCIYIYIICQYFWDYLYLLKYSNFRLKTFRAPHLPLGVQCRTREPTQNFNNLPHPRGLNKGFSLKSS